MKEKIENLIRFAQGVFRQEDVRNLYDTFREEIGTITPQELFLVESEQLKRGMSPTEALSAVDKLVNVFQKSLREYPWKRPESGTFLHIMMDENRALMDRLEELKNWVRMDPVPFKEMAVRVRALSAYEIHLLKMENILFPYLEKAQPRYSGLSIMWALHDRAREALRGLWEALERETDDRAELNRLIGEVYFKFGGMVNKQEWILFPAASEVLDEEAFGEMHRQSFAFGFAFIEPPPAPKQADSVPRTDTYGSRVIPTPTGALTFEQVEQLINTLPVDLTFVNADGKVAFFSRPKDRLFPRSPAIIGRDVRQCHPPESVHIVERILEDFREQRRNQAVFWIQLKGRYILIRYYAVRGFQGEYLGTLEVSEDITEIRGLDGEKRLLDEPGQGAVR